VFQGGRIMMKRLRCKATRAVGPAGTGARWRPGGPADRMRVAQGLRVGACEACLAVRQSLLPAESLISGWERRRFGPGMEGNRWCSIW
jgi:hypothetical protein